MPVSYSDIDRLILERWIDVVGLIEAHRDVQGRIEELVETVGERVARWARPKGFEIRTEARKSEIYAWRRAWADKRKGERISLALGGFCPIGFRSIDHAYPYLWVYTDPLENFRVKEEERIAFSHTLRTALGDRAGDWEAHDVDDADAPLGRYLTQCDNAARARLVMDPDALFDFCTDHFPTLFELADIVEAELQRLGR